MFVRKNCITKSTRDKRSTSLLKYLKSLKYLKLLKSSTCSNTTGNSSELSVELFQKLAMEATQLRSICSYAVTVVVRYYAEIIEGP